ncbi:hypothetical protein C5167_027012, partial [Papaver somniferum]
GSFLTYVNENVTTSSNVPQPVHHPQYGNQFNYYNPQFAGNNFAHSVMSSGSMPSIQHHQNNYHYQFGGYSATFHQQHQQQPYQQFEQQTQQHYYYMNNNINNINYIYTITQKKINKSEQQQQFEEQQQQHYYMNNNISKINYIYTKEINKSEDSAPNFFFFSVCVSCLKWRPQRKQYSPNHLLYLYVQLGEESMPRVMRQLRYIGASAQIST